jgi:hypothetical protein
MAAQQNRVWRFFFYLRDLFPRSFITYLQKGTRHISLL